ncbi:hypothetical protein BKA93DRAFT_754071 [Sparassis latifolia]
MWQPAQVRARMFYWMESDPEMCRFFALNPTFSNLGGNYCTTPWRARILADLNNPLLVCVVERNSSAQAPTFGELPALSVRFICQMARLDKLRQCLTDFSPTPVDPITLTLRRTARCASWGSMSTAGVGTVPELSCAQQAIDHYKHVIPKYQRYSEWTHLPRKAHRDSTGQRAANNSNFEFLLIDQMNTFDCLEEVAGATGTQKMPFINLLAANGEVRDGLKSCTQEVCTSKFDTNGQTMMPVDMPSFDDTHKSQIDILRETVNFLKEICVIYEDGRMRMGVIYMHRISNSGWEEAPKAIGEGQERELANKSLFFKDTLDLGARMHRHYNDIALAKFMFQVPLGNIQEPSDVQRDIGNGVAGGSGSSVKEKSVGSSESSTGIDNIAETGELLQLPGGAGALM